jgi:hypothetical protein
MFCTPEGQPLVSLLSASSQPPVSPMSAPCQPQVSPMSAPCQALVSTPCQANRNAMGNPRSRASGPSFSPADSMFDVGTGPRCDSGCRLDRLSAGTNIRRPWLTLETVIPQGRSMFICRPQCRRSCRLPVPDERPWEFSPSAVLGLGWIFFLLAAAALLLVSPSPCQAGCRGYIQFRVLHGQSTAGQPLAEPEATRARRQSSVTPALPGSDTPCDGPQCHAPPVQPSLPLAPVASWFGAPTSEATLSLPVALAASGGASGILPWTSDRVTCPTLDRLKRPPRC